MIVLLSTGIRAIQINKYRCFVDGPKLYFCNIISQIMFGRTSPMALSYLAIFKFEGSSVNNAANNTRYLVYVEK